MSEEKGVYSVGRDEDNGAMQVSEEGLRTNFMMIPNVIDDMGLSASAMRLYVHLKRVAGEKGSCWQSIKTMAERCNLCEKTVCKAKKELVEKKLIVIAEMHNSANNLYHQITIADIWDKADNTGVTYPVSKKYSTGEYKVQSKKTTVNKTPKLSDNRNLDAVNCEAVNKTEVDKNLEVINIDTRVCGVSFAVKENEDKGVSQTPPEVTAPAPPIDLPDDELGMQVKAQMQAIRALYKTESVVQTAEDILGVEPQVHKPREQLTVQERLMRTQQAVSKFYTTDEAARSLITTELHISPNFDSKAWKDVLLFIKQRPADQPLADWIRWWKRDWRGKDGSPPTANQLRELWPQAFQSKYTFVDDGTPKDERFSYGINV